MSATRTAAVVGIDVGATTMSGGLVTREGDVLHTIQRATHHDGPGTAVESLMRLVDGLLTEARRRGLSLDGVGVGLPGVVDVDKGAMLATRGHRVLEFAHLPLADHLRGATDLPVFVDNDANALALAEWMFGVGRGAHSLVLFAIGTDVGGGLILGDLLFRGSSGYAGELHGLPIDFDDGPGCYCGGRGCLGAYVAGRVIADTARQRLPAGARSAVLDLAGGDPARITSESVFAAAASGDPVARGIVDRACQALGAGIAFVVNGLNPEVVVLTGGVAASLVPLAHDIRSRAAAYAFGPALAGTRIHVIAGDKRQTVRGGAALVLYELARADVSTRG